MREKKNKHYTYSFAVIYVLYLYLCKFLERTKVDLMAVNIKQTITSGGIFEFYWNEIEF